MPIVNDSEYAPFRAVRDYVRWAPPTPSRIADQLVAVLDSPRDPARVADTASGTWRAAQTAFVQALEEEADRD